MAKKNEIFNYYECYECSEKLDPNDFDELCLVDDCYHDCDTGITYTEKSHVPKNHIYDVHRLYMGVCKTCNEE